MIFFCHPGPRTSSFVVVLSFLITKARFSVFRNLLKIPYPGVVEKLQSGQNIHAIQYYCQQRVTDYQRLTILKVYFQNDCTFQLHIAGREKEVIQNLFIV